MNTDLEQLLNRLDLCSDELSDLSQDFRRAVDIAETDPEMSLTRARKILDFIVQDIFEQRIGEPAGTRPLENLLQRLKREGHFPLRIAAYANNVRELGNVGVHGHDKDVSSDDVPRALGQLMPIVEWYFKQRPATGSVASPQPASDHVSHGQSKQADRPASRTRSDRRRFVVVAAVLVVLLAGLLAVSAVLRWMGAFCPEHPRYGFENDLSGWERHTDSRSQGCVRVVRSRNESHEGDYSLEATMHLDGRDPDWRTGEAIVDWRKNPLGDGEPGSMDLNG